MVTIEPGSEVDNVSIKIHGKSIVLDHTTNSDILYRVICELARILLLINRNKE